MESSKGFFRSSTETTDVTCNPKSRLFSWFAKPSFLRIQNGNRKRLPQGKGMLPGANVREGGNTQLGGIKSAAWSPGGFLK